MMELTINGAVYEFNFGFGFLKEINKKVSADVTNLKGVKRNIGLRYYVASIVDGDIEDLVMVLNLANKGMQLRVTEALLESYIEDENTDIDALFDTVLDFLKKNNCTRKTTLDVLEEVAKAKAEAENQN